MKDTALPQSIPRGPMAIFAVLAVVGFLLLVGAGMMSSDPDTVKRAYRVFLHNWLLFAALAQGGLVLSCAMRLTNARWPGRVQRIAESLGAFTPLSLVLFIGIYAGRHELFEWIEHPVHGKEWWFSEGFVFTRDLIALVWMTIVSLIYMVLSLRPMLGDAREKATGWQGALISRVTSGWRGEAAERDLADRRLRKMAAVVCLSYAFCYSLLSVDLIMSLAPHWLSTMFPAYYAWGGFLSAVSMTAFLAVVLRNSPSLAGEITENRRHDLGKMIFAFSIFWMYLFWSQYLVIWYGNIPEETGFIAARLGTQFLQDTWYLSAGIAQPGSLDDLGFWGRLAQPYVQVTLTAWILCWVIPFVILMGQKPKKTPAILATVALLSVVGFWIERYILVTPSLVTPDDVLAGAPITLFGWIELATTAGFVGLFFLSFLAYARGFPGALPASD